MSEAGAPGLCIFLQCRAREGSVHTLHPSEKHVSLLLARPHSPHGIRPFLVTLAGKKATGALPSRASHAAGVEGESDCPKSCGLLWPHPGRPPLPGGRVHQVPCGQWSGRWAARFLRRRSGPEGHVLSRPTC